MSAYERRLAVENFVKEEFAKAAFDQIMLSNNEKLAQYEEKQKVLKKEPLKKPTY